MRRSPRRWWSRRRRSCRPATAPTRRRCRSCVLLHASPCGDRPPCARGSTLSPVRYRPHMPEPPTPANPDSVSCGSSAPSGSTTSSPTSPRWAAEPECTGGVAGGATGRPWAPVQGHNKRGSPAGRPRTRSWRPTRADFPSRRAERHRWTTARAGRRRHLVTECGRLQDRPLAGVHEVLSAARRHDDELRAGIAPPSSA